MHCRESRARATVLTTRPPREPFGRMAPTRGSAPASFAFLPLRTHQTFGLLALASDDPARFYAGMGTMHLTRLAELASVATARFLPQT